MFVVKGHPNIQEQNSFIFEKKINMERMSVFHYELFLAKALSTMCQNTITKQAF
jgi:hypothetical protein